MPSAHADVKHELLVRYLDAWLPAAAHGHKRVTYVDSGADGESAAAAARVFAEFPDLLARHTLTMVLSCPSVERAAGHRGLGADHCGRWAAVRLSRRIGGLRVDRLAAGRGAAARPAAAVGRRARSRTSARPVSRIWPGSSSSTPPGPPRRSSSAPGRRRRWRPSRTTCGRWTSTPGSATATRATPEHTLLDISLQPNLRPLRRLLVAHLRSNRPLVPGRPADLGAARDHLPGRGRDPGGAGAGRRARGRPHARWPVASPPPP